MIHIMHMKFVRKTITIKEGQDKYIKRENISLSRLVQSILEKKMKGGNKKQ